MTTTDKQRRFHADLIDSYDEEFEMEIDDRFRRRSGLLR